MTFEKLGVALPLREAIEKMGFGEPMPIQAEVIPLLLGESRDIIALAQTGSGKTAAFGLPILQNLSSEIKQPQALILAPTRELCMQITRDLAQFAIHLPEVSILAVYGGASIEEQIRHLKRGVQVVVATPGRLLDLIRREAIRLDQVYDVVLDEADEMLNMGFSEDIDKILEEIPEERHLLLFSATMPEEIRRITRKYMQSPMEISVGEELRVNRDIKHLYYVVASKDRYLALKRIVDYYPDVYGIVFCKTRRSTQEIAEQLIQDGYNADALHGELSQAQRDHVMNRFRIGAIQLLVATDVAARGLDVNDLTHVIHYGLPAEVESYTHRSGRTGRAGKKGLSIAICHARERGLIRRIEEQSGIAFERALLPSAEDICEKQLLHFIHKLEHTVPDLEAIEPYMDGIIKRLNWLDRDEILQRLVYLELKRMLDYYENAVKVEEVPDKPEKRERPERKNRSERAASGMALLQVNLGKQDKLYPNVLIDLIDHAMGFPIDLGKITVFDRNATFEIKQEHAEIVQDTLNEYEYRDKPIRVTRHNVSGKSKRRPVARPKRKTRR